MSFVVVGVSTAASALMQISAGQDAKSAANINAAQADYQAKVEEGNAYRTAQLIRKAGRRATGAANAAYAGAGVVVGEGSAAATEQEIIRNTETDAFQTLLEGGRKARGLRTDATLSRISGDQAETAGYINAATTVLGAAAQYGQASGWRSKGPGYSGTQRDAPVVNRDLGRK
jgi:hypothetical protein